MVSDGLLDQFTDVFLENGTITFKGFRDRKPVEIFRNKAGTLSTLLGPETSMPRGGFVFGGLDTVFFRVVSVDGDNVAFEFSGPINSSHIAGTYIRTETEFLHLREPHTLLDAKKALILRFSRDGLDGTSLVFVAKFQDGTRAVYRADLVSPGQ